MRALLCRGNQAGLFQQNRPFSADIGYEACWSNPMRQMATRIASGSSSGLQFRIDDAIGIEAVASSRKRLSPCKIR